jgi:hypothetical protein
MESSMLPLPFWRQTALRPICADGKGLRNGLLVGRMAIMKKQQPNVAIRVAASGQTTVLAMA